MFQIVTLYCVCLLLSSANVQSHLCGTWSKINYIQLPFTEPQELSSGFENAHGMPQCLGAIDGTHIEIKQLYASSTDCKNRRRKFSISLQAVCDYKYCFMDAVMRWPWGVHDAHMFTKSHTINYFKERSLHWKSRLWMTRSLFRFFFRGTLPTIMVVQLPRNNTLDLFCVEPIWSSSADSAG